MWGMQSTSGDTLGNSFFLSLFPLGVGPEEILLRGGMSCQTRLATRAALGGGLALRAGPRCQAWLTRPHFVPSWVVAPTICAEPHPQDLDFVPSPTLDILVLCRVRLTDP